VELVETKQRTADKLSEEFVTTLIHSSQIGVYVAQDGKFEIINPQIMKVLGFSQDQLLGKNALSLVHPEDRAMVRENAIKMLKGERREPYEFRVCDKDGNIKVVIEAVVPVIYKGKRAVLGNFMDVTERKQVEQELRRAKEQFQGLVEESPLGVALITRDGHYQYVNPKFVKMFGYTLEEVPTGQEWFAKAHPDPEYRTKVISTWKTDVEAAEHGERPNRVFTVTCKDGSEKVIYFRTVTLETGDYLIIHEDITERKQAEELYQTLTSSSPVGIYIVQDGKFQFVNPQFQKYTGYSEDELLGTESLELVHPEDRERVRENAVEMLKGKSLAPYELRYIVKGGKILWATETVTSIQYKGKRAVLGNFMDITKHKQAEEALRENREQLRKMFESVTDGISVIDLNGIITEVNQRAVEIHGFNSKNELVGKNAFELVAPRDHEKITANMRKAIKEGKIGGVEYTLLKANGTEFPAELSTSVLRNASGNPAGHITIVRDITERKVMEEQLMLTDRLASIGELASGIAHELNNPLTSIIGFSQLLMERKDTATDVKEDLGLVHSEAQRAAGIVKNLLTFARKHAPVKQPSQINNIIEDVLKLRAYEQKVSNIDVVKRFDPALPEVLIDHFQIRQVFLNLIINAEYFMAEAHNRGTLTITTKRSDNIAMISIADDGPGISKENLSRIFSPFYTTKEVGKGTGLGLSICHGIVAEHSGNIYVRSQLGKGATFVVELPISSS